jgi:ABC-type polysaccharide/polyol phosphate transport system ATPase subunit
MTSHIVSNPTDGQRSQRRNDVSRYGQSKDSDHQTVAPIIKLQDVAVRYRVPQERIPTFKEYAIRRLRGQVRYNSFWALQNINLEIFPGEVFGIIGPNGAGKSTLLKVIARVLYPTRGRVQITGRVAPLLELGAGFDPELTGRENIYLNGAILGYTKTQIDAIFPEIVEFSGLQEFINAPLRTYSTGMFARLGFSVATASRPDILIVDEILGVGDAEFQTKSYERIQSFKASGTTILLVSHSLERVEEICSRAMWLEHGEMVGLGSARTVALQYNRRTMEKESDRLTAERQAAAQNPSAPAVQSEKPTQAAPLPAPGEKQTQPDSPILELAVKQTPAPSAEPPASAPIPAAHSPRWGSHTVEITRVQIKSGPESVVEQGIFETGQPFVLQMDYVAHNPVTGAVFGMAIHRHDGLHITGPNTDQAGKKLPKLVGTGKIIYKIAHLPLLEGLYHVSVAVVDQDDTETFDYHDRLYPFRVVNQGKEQVERYGMVTLNGHWEHERSRDG